MRTFLASLFLGLILTGQHLTGQTPPVAPAGASSPAIEDRARGVLNEALKDKNPDTRMQAVQALGLTGPREPYLSLLESMLDDRRFASRDYRERIREAHAGLR